ncbi:MAG: hypothetical protein KGR18_11225 [Acidobacteria bacterium]|nr:hypothetical protein [Acidobacteriota bacterium]
MSRRTQRLIFAAVLLALALPIVIAAIGNAHDLAPPAGDQAIIDMYVQDIPAHLPLVGVYSRLGFHHPGPMLYLLLAVPVHLLGPYGMNLTAAALAIASIAGLLVVFHRRGGQALFALGAVFCAVLTTSMGLDLLSVWNPYVLILPFALTVALAWSVWCRDWSALPWLMLVGSFVVQAHLGLALPVAFLLASSAAIAVGVAVRNRRAAGPTPTEGLASGAAPTAQETVVAPAPTVPRRTTVLTLLIAAVAWFPPLLEQVTSQPGNISLIIDFGTSNPEGHRLGITPALGLLGMLMARTTPMGVNEVSATRVLDSLHGPAVLWGAVPAILLVIIAVLAHRRGLRSQRRLSLLLLGLDASAVIAASTITGLPFVYLVRWIVVISCFIGLAIIWTLLAMVIPDLHQRSLLPMNSWVRSIVIGAAVLYALIPLNVSEGYINDASGSRVLEQVVMPIHDALEGCGLTLVEPTSDPLELEIVSGVVADLRRRGIDAVVIDEYSFAHGRRHSIDGRAPSCVIQVAVADPERRMEGTLIASSAPFVIRGQSMPAVEVWRRS